MLKYPNFVDRKGTLLPQFIPAVYLDTSVVIDYWLAEGLEWDWPHDEVTQLLEKNERKDYQVIRELFKADKRVTQMADIRKKLRWDQTRVRAITSPLSMIELMEWQAETGFKETASEAVSVAFMQRKSKKEIGNYLRTLVKMRETEIKANGKPDNRSTGLETIMEDIWVSRSNIEHSGLQGIIQAPIKSFNLTIDDIWAEPSALAVFQLGAADILHVLFCHHLGCKYLASFDEDFFRVSDIVFKKWHIEIINCPERLQSLL